MAHGQMRQELDVDEDEEDRDRRELDRELTFGDLDRILAALERLGLHRRESPRRDPGSACKHERCRRRAREMAKTMSIGA